MNQSNPAANEVSSAGAMTFAAVTMYRSAICLLITPSYYTVVEHASLQYNSLMYCEMHPSNTIV